MTLWHRRRFLEHLGCAGLNWGVGYEDYHSTRAHAWLNDTFAMVGRFMEFYAVHQDRQFEHTLDERSPWGRFGPFWWDDFDFQCLSCKAPIDDGYCELCDIDWFDDEDLPLAG